MSASDARPIEIVLPAHNEAATIGPTIEEFHRVTAGAGLDVRFIVCEDGSSDGTAEVVRELGSRLPVTLISSPERKGYSRAVIDGLRASSAELVGFIDSDGQCDPADLANLVRALAGADLVVGYRNPRADSLTRKAMSASFKFVYERLFPIRLKDPSCPYLLIRQPALAEVLTGRLGVLKQGFWWEFNARAEAAGLAMRQVPVTHRVRAGGQTQVYLPTKVPRIAAEHLLGLWQLRKELGESRD